ncbi:ATP-grasp domain-containing protein [Streptomyces sp. NPDC003032]
MSEHVLVLGNGYDIPGRMRARGCALDCTITTSVLCLPGHLAKLEEPEGHARIIAVGADAPDEQWIALARAIHALDPVTRIGTFADQCQEVAADVGRALGVPTHHPETVRLTFDKCAMRGRLAETGVEAVVSAEMAGPDELREFATSHGYPCVVKPQRGTASTGVSVIRTPQEADAAFSRARGTGEPADVMAEEFLRGDQYSVEAFSEHGEHVTVAITRKYSDPASLVELGHVMPAPLAPEQEQVIRACVSAALDSLGVEFGPTHTEVVLTESGPRLIETHLRVGGDEIWNMVTDATGVDLVEYQLRQCIGEKVLPDLRAVLADPERARRAEAIWFAGAPETGTLIEIAGADSTLAEGVQLDLLGKLGHKLVGPQNSDSRLAQARAHADTATGALALARETIGRLTFVTRVSRRASGPAVTTPVVSRRTAVPTGSDARDTRSVVSELDGHIVSMVLRRAELARRDQAARQQAGLPASELAWENAVVNRYADQLGRQGADIALAVLALSRNYSRCATVSGLVGGSG